MAADQDHPAKLDNDSSKVAQPPLRKSVHRSLGGGSVADLLLWKRRNLCILLLVFVTTVWFLFEQAGYSLLSLISNVLLLLVAILFFWAKSAALLNRPLPPLPNLEVSEDHVRKMADSSRLWINRVLAVAHDIALGKDVKLFFQVVISLWFISFIGSLFSFLTLIYIGVVLSLTIPVLYDKYQDRVDDKLSAAHKVLLKQYRKIDDSVLSKIPIPLSKEKKAQ